MLRPDCSKAAIHRSINTQAVCKSVAVDYGLYQSVEFGQCEMIFFIQILGSSVLCFVHTRAGGAVIITTCPQCLEYPAMNKHKLADAYIMEMEMVHT